MFIDEAIVKLEAGKGGDGCTSFRREKHVPLGGPDGGNGGKGGDIIFKVDEGLRTLLDFKFKKTIKADKGENGSSQNQTGKRAENVIVKVPAGTVITDVDSKLVLADLRHHNEEFVVAYGGRGGRGNRSFATDMKPAPEISEYGEPGEVRMVKLELKLLADVGLVGLPSVGKSTIISKISASKPKIAAYHFTTLVPNLGVVRTKDQRTFVVADLPGLIEGASLGEGLGDRFLRHIERTRVIVHVIDMSGVEGRDPYDDYLVINKELEAFNPTLIKKPQVVVANKMDMDVAKEHLIEFKKKVTVPIFEVSAIQGEGLESLLLYIADLLDKIEIEPLYDEEQYESHVLYKFKSEKPFTIEKVDDKWIVRGEQVEKLLRMTKFATQESALRFAQKLRYMGIDDELKKMGAKPGDTISILNYEFEFRE